jgi:hypothetical protein
LDLFFAQGEFCCENRVEVCFETHGVCVTARDLRSCSQAGIYLRTEIINNTLYHRRNAAASRRQTSLRGGCPVGLRFNFGSGIAG